VTFGDWSDSVAGAARGDAEAIEALLASNLPRLRAYVRLRMGAQLRAKESASDLVQSACREVLSHLDRFQFGSEAGFRRWLFTTAARKIADRLDYYRAEKRAVEREAGTLDPDADLGALYADFLTPSADLDMKEAVARLEAAFDRLSDEHREVITLSRLVGLSHREVGAAMGRSEPASRMLLFRALSHLAAELDPREP
jgi:RNA polymerase sigma-70 factor (ECF subfamily)